MTGNSGGRAAHAIWVLLTAVVLFSATEDAQAYVGPGPGIGLLGSLLAVLLVVVIGVFALVLYPIRVMKRRKRRREAADAESSDRLEAEDRST